MAAICAKPLAALCCLVAFCALCNAQDNKPDVSLDGIYQNITDIAAFAASTKVCSANDTLCQALKKLLIPPPPPAFPPGAPGPSPFGYCPSAKSDIGDGSENATYCLPLTNITDPGNQNRDTIGVVNPSSTNPGQFPSIVDKARQAQTGGDGSLTSFVGVGPATPATMGGWTLLTTDTGNTMIHAIPLSNGQILIMERPGNRESPPLIAAVYNLNTNNYRYFPMMDSPFCSGHIRLIDETVLIIGGDNVGVEPGFGDGRYSVRVFTPGARPNYVTTDIMQPYFSPAIDPNSGARWYPTLLTMIDGNVLIASGATTDGGVTSPTYQVFLFNTKRVTPNQYLAQLRATDPNNLYPFMVLLPTGAIMIVSGAVSQFYRYSTTTNLLTNDTTTYPAVPNLPVPICYSQTASLVMLPLEQPGYNPRILVIGGSSANFAGPDTPATPATYLLDFSIRPLAWVREDMSSPRVMPDGVLLPDGSVLIANGGNLGVAGGGPGGGGGTNTAPFLDQQCEIYNTSFPVGSRMTGLLANSTRNRLYHSVAWLTQNAEVLVSGSEVTSDYTAQIYTPPYLEGTFARPLLGAASNTSPAYGATITIPFTFTGGPAVRIARVVVNRIGGITHSLHYDQRQVSLAFTSTANVLTLTMPPSATIATPGVYTIYAVTAFGRPSAGVDVGLGGATPRAPYFQPVQTPYLANGVYTISSVGLAGCAAGNVLAGGQTCADGGGVNIGLAGTWTMTLVPGAPDDNTYNIVNALRPDAATTCNGNLSCARCPGGGVDQFGVDDRSGRQRWTLFPAAGGGYNIRVLYGRYGCNQYLSAAACGQNPVYLEAGDLGAGLQSWAFTAQTPPPPPPSGPPFANGQYQITNVGRNAGGCSNTLADQACAVGAGVNMGTTGYWNLIYLPNALQANTYSVIASDRQGICASYLSCADCGGTLVDIYGVDDNSGRQQWTFTPVAGVAGGYTITVQRGRAACGQELVAASCTTSTTVYMDPGTAVGTLGVWQLTARPTQQLFSNGQYSISSVGRSATAGCANQLTDAACNQGNGVAMGLSGFWSLTLLTGAPQNNTYSVVAADRQGTCASYLSCTDCGANVVDIFGADDGSGRQQWTFTPVAGGYTITTQRGRPTCGIDMVAAACATSTRVYMDPGTTVGNLAVWSVTPRPSNNQLFANGQYMLNNVGRTTTTGCANSLSDAACSSGTGVSMGLSGYWSLTLLTTAPQNNTYSVIAVDRQGICGAYLSCQDCGGTLVDVFGADDNSGRQQWTFTPVNGGYTITVQRGRATCGQELVAASCATSTAVYMDPGTTVGTLGVWQVVPRPTTNQYFPNGQYNVTVPARIGRGCNGILNAVPCTAGAAVNLDGGNLGGWTFTYLFGSANQNTYEVVSTTRNGVCGAFLSCTDCGANLVDLFGADDNSGRQQWVFTQVTGGYYIQILNGRPTCGQYLSAPATCVVGQGLTFATAPDATGNQVFAVTMI